MSYDVWFETDDPDPAEFGGPWTRNYTYNLAPMWREAGLSSLRALDGEQASYVAGGLSEVIARLAGDPEKFRALNPANGWGDYDSGLNFLRWIRDMCRKLPNAIVRVG